MSSNESWLLSLRAKALEFCQTVALIDAPPEVRPWNTNQVLWSGARAPDPVNPVFAYHLLGPDQRQVAILGPESRACFSQFVELFAQEQVLSSCYGESFLRDMLVGLLQMSLPGAPLTLLPSPYWKRYVTPAVTQLRAGSPERYAEAVVTAIRALPAPHPQTVVVLPLAGVHLLAPATLAGITLIPDAACTSDADLAPCGMFLHRLKELRSRADGQPLVFAKLAVQAEPGLAVQRAVARTEQVCRMLRLLPNPGLADGPLADPPRIDLDASDSAAFYIAEKSVGTHPIPVRRATSEPQGRLGNWRVQPRLETPAWQRLARLIEEGARSDLDARLLTGLRHLGEATADFSAAAAVVGSLTAVRGMIGAPEGGETSALADAVARLARSTGTGPAASPRSVPPGREDQGPEVRARFAAVASLGEQLAHDLECTVTPELRADAVWLAFGVLEALLERPELRGYRDLQALLASPT